MNAEAATAGPGGALPAPLLGLFRALVALGLPLGTRDYLDGLRALSLDFGTDRDGLRRLAQQLWARTEAERRLVALWFDAVPADAAELSAAIGALLDTDRAAHEAAPAESQAGAAAARSGRAAADAAMPPHAAAPAARARASFAAVREGGLPLPRLAAEPPIGEDYLLQPSALVGLRELAVLWRRFRRGTRRGPRTELDLPGTVRERCRRGLLERPVLRARRSNSARLLVLADASPSMDPWRPWLQTLEESLRFARFASAEMRYFANLPRGRLYATPALTGAEPADELLRRHAGAALLVVSDAGSARGFLNRRRAAQTSAFLAEAAKHFGSGLWLNPMPRERWAGSSAALVARSPAITMLPLDAAHLLRGIDILRGNK